MRKSRKSLSASQSVGQSASQSVSQSVSQSAALVRNCRLLRFEPMSVGQAPMRVCEGDGGFHEGECLIRRGVLAEMSDKEK